MSTGPLDSSLATRLYTPAAKRPEPTPTVAEKMPEAAISTQDSGQIAVGQQGGSLSAVALFENTSETPATLEKLSDHMFSRGQDILQLPALFTQTPFPANHPLFKTLDLPTPLEPETQTALKTWLDENVPIIQSEMPAYQKSLQTLAQMSQADLALAGELFHFIYEHPIEAFHIMDPHLQQMASRLGLNDDQHFSLYMAVRDAAVQQFENKTGKNATQVALSAYLEHDGRQTVATQEAAEVMELGDRLDSIAGEAVSQLIKEQARGHFQLGQADNSRYETRLGERDEPLSYVMSRMLVTQKFDPERIDRLAGILRKFTSDNYRPQLSSEDQAFLLTHGLHWDGTKLQVGDLQQGGIKMPLSAFEIDSLRQFTEVVAHPSPAMKAILSASADVIMKSEKYAEINGELEQASQELGNQTEQVDAQRQAVEARTQVVESLQQQLEQGQAQTEEVAQIIVGLQSTPPAQLDPTVLAKWDIRTETDSQGQQCFWFKDQPIEQTELRLLLSQQVGPQLVEQMDKLAQQLKIANADLEKELQTMAQMGANLKAQQQKVADLKAKLESVQKALAEDQKIYEQTLNKELPHLTPAEQQAVAPVITETKRILQVTKAKIQKTLERTIQAQQRASDVLIAVYETFNQAKQGQAHLPQHLANQLRKLWAESKTTVPTSQPNTAAGAAKANKAEKQPVQTKSLAQKQAETSDANQQAQLFKQDYKDKMAVETQKQVIENQWIQHHHRLEQDEQEHQQQRRAWLKGE